MIRFALLCCALALAASGANAQTPVERCNYLVNTILTCGNCHTPRGPGGMTEADLDAVVAYPRTVPPKE